MLHITVSTSIKHKRYYELPYHVTCYIILYLNGTKLSQTPKYINTKYITHKLTKNTFYTEKLKNNFLKLSHKISISAKQVTKLRLICELFLVFTLIYYKTYNLFLLLIYVKFLSIKPRYYFKLCYYVTYYIILYLNGTKHSQIIKYKNTTNITHKITKNTLYTETPNNYFSKLCNNIRISTSNVTKLKLHYKLFLLLTFIYCKTNNLFSLLIYVELSNIKLRFYFKLYYYATYHIVSYLKCTKHSQITTHLTITYMTYKFTKTPFDIETLKNNCLKKTHITSVSTSMVTRFYYELFYCVTCIIIFHFNTENPTQKIIYKITAYKMYYKNSINITSYGHALIKGNLVKKYNKNKRNIITHRLSNILT